MTSVVFLSNSRKSVMPLAWTTFHRAYTRSAAAQLLDRRTGTSRYSSWMTTFVGVTTEHRPAADDVPLNGASSAPVATTTMTTKDLRRTGSLRERQPGG